MITETKPIAEQRVRLRAGDRERTMLVVRPSRPVPGAPVILVFHGSGQTGKILRTFAGKALDGFAKHDGAVVMYLDGYRRNWNDARKQSNFPARQEGYDDVAFAQAAIAWSVQEAGAAPERAFAIGFSNGGAMVIRLAHEIPEAFVAMAAIAATLPVESNFLFSDARPAPVPVLYIHGTKDRLVPFHGGMASLWGFRPRGLGRSAYATAEYSARQNGITTEPTTHEVSQRIADKTSATITNWTQDGHPPVRLVTLDGGGHTMPGSTKAAFIMGRTSGQVETAELIREFFQLPVLPAAA